MSPFFFEKDEQVLQFIGREDVNQYVVISYTMLVSEKAELEIEVYFKEEKNNNNNKKQQKNQLHHARL